jgi:hypothetical protein
MALFIICLLQRQAHKMSTLKTINIVHPSGSPNNIVSDASGNVTVGNNLYVTEKAGVGTTSPQFKFNSVQGAATSAPSVTAAIQVYAKGFGGGGQQYAGIGFAMNEHTNGYWGSGVLARDDTGSYGSALSFYTSTGSATPTPTERVRIDSSGNLLLTAAGSINLNTLNTYTASGNGYQKLPSGVIIQWGKTGSISTGGNSAVTFPVAFPAACWVVLSTLEVASGSNSFGVSHGTPSTSGVTLYSNGSVAGPHTWIAIGN